jgi:hypothetical protein
MKVGDLVSLDGSGGKKLTGIVLKIDQSRKVGHHVFPCFVSWSTGQTDWMREDFLEVINESR